MLSFRYIHHFKHFRDAHYSKESVISNLLFVI